MSDSVATKNRVNLLVGTIDRIENNNEVMFKNCYVDFSSFELATQTVGLVTLDSCVAASPPSIFPMCAGGLVSQVVQWSGL
jgi:hypothetical protein